MIDGHFDDVQGLNPKVLMIRRKVSLATQMVVSLLYIGLHPAPA